jgi:hypothetical protein
MRPGSIFGGCLIVLALIHATPAKLEAADSASKAKASFASPSREFSTAPLWVWNDMLTDDQVLGTLREFAAQNVKQAFVHPRPGLMTPYMSAEWMRLWKLALAEAEKLDMNLWIYDENSYPSGFAGGFVPEAMPESRGRGLGLTESGQAPAWSEDTIAVYKMTGSGYENVTAAVQRGEKPAGQRFVIASLLRAKPSPWYGGKFYVDLLYPGVTQKFLDLTLEPYRKEIGAQFGKRVPGSFTDEPQLRPAGGLPWTADLPQLFEKRWGYRLTDHLPALREQVGDWKKIRHNYFQLLLDTFIDRWAKPYYEYCEKNRIEFTGHYWEHEWPNSASVPDNMAMSAWQQRPGIDTLMNQYKEDTHAQFGNVRAVKEISSLANQLGRARTLVELYGAGGWDLRFEDMKRIGDWLEVLGINTLDQHLSYVTLRGARKRDHPQSFSYHEPWWPAYHSSASYFTRVTYALTRGEQIHKILVLEPTTSAWMYNQSGKNPPELEKLGDLFQKLVVDLEKAQVEYDIGCESVIAQHGSIARDGLSVGRRNYQTVILPPMTENLNRKTLDLLKNFLDKGGTVLSCGPAPSRVEGQESPEGAVLAKAAGWKTVEPSALAGMLQAASKDGFSIRKSDGDKGILFHHRRHLEDGQFLFLVNSSIEAPTAGIVESPARGVEKWDLETGKVSAYPFETAGPSSRVAFELPPAGSLLLFLSNIKQAPGEAAPKNWAPVGASGDLSIHRAGPNVLVLDYLDVQAGGETKRETYYYQASQFAFKANGMERNPWDSAVQFKDELITRKFPDGSGVTATYRFTIKDKIPAPLFAVVERPDLYNITINGKNVKAAPGSWWLDKAFGKIDIAAAVRVGENEIVLKAAPFTIYHELESVYVLGDFALAPLDKGFAIVPENALKLGDWNSQGLPFYSAGMTYARKFEIAKPHGPYRVFLPGWYGSVAEVKVNGKPAGYIGNAPWQADVSALIKPGGNTIEVTVIGTLKNTLGPHHGEPSLGTAWPAMFQKAPASGPPAGSQYSTVGYGLAKPFELLEAKR